MVKLDLFIWRGFSDEATHLSGVVQIVGGQI
jgi:hypothetical protein